MTRRLALLLDPGSFVPRFTDGEGELVGGTGTIGGRRVCIIAINPEPCGQVDAFAVLQQEHALLDLAEAQHLPIIHLADRPGRVAMETTAIPLTIMQTFIDSRGAGRIFARFAHLSGVVPRIAVVFNPIATTLTYPVAECDTVVMMDRAGMSLARPDMVRLMTGDTSTYEDYGGARMHTEISGTSDKLVFSEKEAIDWVRKYIAFFPSHFTGKPPEVRSQLPEPDYPPLSSIIPADTDLPFDMHEVVHFFIDEGSFLEHRARYAREVITAFARVGGKGVGIIANNPEQKGGILFSESCRKIAAFASLCDAFNIPLVFLADIPGFMVGKTAEQSGIIHNGALVFTTIANLSVPHICVVVRKAYTAGLYAMGGAGFDPERFVAFPDASITIYGPKAIQLLAKESRYSEEAQLTMADQIKENCNVLRYVESGVLDAVIGEDDLRAEVDQFLEHFYKKPLDRTTPRRVLCL
ncbi:MAG: carboxyl transferase domain-containing protein [Methanoregula sp.]